MLFWTVRFYSTLQEICFSVFYWWSSCDSSCQQFTVKMDSNFFTVRIIILRHWWPSSASRPPLLSNPLMLESLSSSDSAHVSHYELRVYTINKITVKVQVCCQGSEITLRTSFNKTPAHISSHCTGALSDACGIIFLYMIIFITIFFSCFIFLLIIFICLIFVFYFTCNMLII